MAHYRLRDLLAFLTLISLSLAATRTSFCKCTCFSNSSLIALTPPKTSISQPADQPVPHVGHTCNDCNKDFCKSYSLAICADATDDDMFTTCFQRDSAKDEAVIYIFIFATVGLLVWAGVKPLIGKRMDRTESRSTYAPLRNDQ